MKNLILLTALLLNGCFAVAQQYIQKQDTSTINVLVNPGFENAKGGYTFSVSSTATIVSGTNAIQGSASLRFDSTAASQTVQTALYTMPSTKRTGSVSECQGDLRYLTDESTNKYLFRILDASGTVVSTKILEPVSIATTAINFFTCVPQAKAEVISTGSAVKIDLDSLHLGSRKDLLKIDVTESLGYEPVANVTGTNPITITGTASSPVVGFLQSGAVSGSTYTKVAVDGFGRVTSGTTIINSDLPDSGIAASTYTKVTVNSKGVLTSGTTLIESDVPSLQTTKITSGIFTVPFGGTGVSSVTTGDLLIGSISALTKLPIGSNGHILTVSGGTTVWAANSGASGTASVAPTIQKFTSASGTYTLPTSPRTPLYIRVRMVGGGGGGGGSGTASNGTGGTGGDSTFGTSLLLAGGGSGGAGGGAATSGGAGGGFTLGAGAIGTALTGGSGESAVGTNVDTQYTGGSGGSTPFGGAGAATNGGGSGRSGATNTGSGGGGGGTGGTASSFPGNGGGASGFVDAIIRSPSATYPYAVGAGGTQGTQGTSGNGGGAGGSGYIEVTEYYQ